MKGLDFNPMESEWLEEEVEAYEHVKVEKGGSGSGKYMTRVTLHEREILVHSAFRDEKVIQKVSEIEASTDVGIAVNVETSKAREVEMPVKFSMHTALIINLAMVKDFDRGNFTKGGDNR